MYGNTIDTQGQLRKRYPGYRAVFLEFFKSKTFRNLHTTSTSMSVGIGVADPYLLYTAFDPAFPKISLPNPDSGSGYECRIL